MLYEEKLRLLRALPTLKRIPQTQLGALAKFLRPRTLKDQEVLFQQGSMGMSLYFVSTGRIRISRRVAHDEHKDLAHLGPGDIFGETALVEEASRMASAIAEGETVLFELFRGDLSRWVKANPQQAVQFFAELVHIQTRRLRRTSNELTLHYDLSNMLLDKSGSPNEFLTSVVDRVFPHLEGDWSAAAYLMDEAGDRSVVVSRGPREFKEVPPEIISDKDIAVCWIGGQTLHIALIGKDRMLGGMIFHSGAPLPQEMQDELDQTLSTVPLLVSTVLEKM